MISRLDGAADCGGIVGRFVDGMVGELVDGGLDFGWREGERVGTRLGDLEGELVSLVVGWLVFSPLLALEGEIVGRDDGVGLFVGVFEGWVVGLKEVGFSDGKTDKGFADLDGFKVGKALAGRTEGGKVDFFVGDLVGRRVGIRVVLTILVSLIVKMYLVNFLLLSKLTPENITWTGPYAGLQVGIVDCS